MGERVAIAHRSLERVWVAEWVLRDRLGSRLGSETCGRTYQPALGHPPGGGHRKTGGANAGVSRVSANCALRASTAAHAAFTSSISTPLPHIVLGLLGFRRDLVGVPWSQALRNNCDEKERTVLTSA